MASIFGSVMSQLDRLRLLWASVSLCFLICRGELKVIRGLNAPECICSQGQGFFTVVGTAGRRGAELIPGLCLPWSWVLLAESQCRVGSSGSMAS